MAKKKERKVQWYQRCVCVSRMSIMSNEPKKYNEQWAWWAMSMMSTMSMLSTISKFQMSFECISMRWVYSKKSLNSPKMNFFFQILEPCLLWGSPLFLKCPSRTGGATSAFPHSIIDNHDKKYIGGGRRGRKDWDTYYYSLSDTHTSAPKMSQRMCSKNIRVVSHVWPGCVKT